MSEVKPETLDNPRFRISDIYRTLAAVAAVIVITEIFLRLFVISPSATIPDSQLGWKYQANTSILHSSEGYARNQINSLGLNDQEPAGTGQFRRIIAVGDSYTEALQVAQQDNFTSVIERLSPCLEVLNAGRAGATVVHFPLIVDRLNEEITFSDILIVLNSTDFDDLQRSNFEIIYDDDEETITNIIVTEQPLSRLRVLFDPVLSRSSLATFLKNRLKQARMGATVTDEPAGAVSAIADTRADDADMPAQILRFALQKMQETAAVHVLYIPTLEYLANGQTTELDNSLRASATIQSVTEAIDVPFSRVDGFAETYRQSNQPASGFANNDIRRGHLNLSGHKLVANSAVDLISPNCPE